MKIQVPQSFSSVEKGDNTTIQKSVFTNLKYYTKHMLATLLVVGAFSSFSSALGQNKLEGSTFTTEFKQYIDDKEEKGGTTYEEQQIWKMLETGEFHTVQNNSNHTSFSLEKLYPKKHDYGYPYKARRIDVLKMWLRKKGMYDMYTKTPLLFLEKYGSKLNDFALAESIILMVDITDFSRSDVVFLYPEYKDKKFLHGFFDSDFFEIDNDKVVSYLKKMPDGEAKDDFVSFIFKENFENIYNKTGFDIFCSYFRQNYKEDFRKLLWSEVSFKKPGNVLKFGEYLDLEPFAYEIIKSISIYHSDEILGEYKNFQNIEGARDLFDQALDRVENPFDHLNDSVLNSPVGKEVLEKYLKLNIESVFDVNESVNDSIYAKMIITDAFDYNLKHTPWKIAGAYYIATYRSNKQELPDWLEILFHTSITQSIENIRKNKPEAFIGYYGSVYIDILGEEERKKIVQEILPKVSKSNPGVVISQYDTYKQIVGSEQILEKTLSVVEDQYLGYVIELYQESPQLLDSLVDMDEIRTRFSVFDPGTCASHVKLWSQRECAEGMKKNFSNPYALSELWFVLNGNGPRQVRIDSLESPYFESQRLLFESMQQNITSLRVGNDTIANPTEYLNFGAGILKTYAIEPQMYQNKDETVNRDKVLGTYEKGLDEFIAWGETLKQQPLHRVVAIPSVKNGDDHNGAFEYARLGLLHHFDTLQTNGSFVNMSENTPSEVLKKIRELANNDGGFIIAYLAGHGGLDAETAHYKKSWTASDFEELRLLTEEHPNIFVKIDGCHAWKKNLISPDVKTPSNVSLSSGNTVSYGSSFCSSGEYYILYGSDMLILDAYRQSQNGEYNGDFNDDNSVNFAESFINTYKNERSLTPLVYKGCFIF